MRKEKRFAPGRHGASVLREAAQLLCAVMACLWLAGCDDDYADNVSTARNQLEVSVKTNLTKAGTGLITGNFLPDGATLGVTLRKSDGSRYDGQDYTNVLYTASGTESEQTWAGPAQNPILLSATEGTAYAYFPRLADLADITQIPISNETETDYMVSHPANNLSIANKTATFNMEHVMSVIRCTVVKGNYTGTGAINSISVKGNTAATNAKLNVLTQQLSDIAGTGTAITKEGSWTLTNITDQDLWAVPSGESSALTFAVSVDGNNMMAASESLEILPGKIYTYTLTINSNTLTISKVNVTDWDIVAKDNLTPEVKSIWETLEDGVYAVSANWEPVLSTDADASCVGVAVVNSALNQCFVIEKYGEKNESYKEAHIAYGGMNASSAESDPGSSDLLYSIFSYGGGDAHKEGLVTYTTMDGTNPMIAFESNSLDAPIISKDCSTWADGALTDISGYENSQIWKHIVNNGSWDRNFTPMGYLLNYFNESSNNLNFNDWFIPSAAQMSIILLNINQINALLEAIDGHPIEFDTNWGISPMFLTSTEFFESPNYGVVSLGYGANTFGNVIGGGSGDTYVGKVRLVREPMQIGRNTISSVSGNSMVLSGHTINFTGNMSGLSLKKQSSSDGGVVITISSEQPGYFVNEIETTGDATITKSHSIKQGVTRIKITAPASDITLTFNGISPMVEAVTLTGNTTGLSLNKRLSSDGYIEVVATPTISNAYVAPGTTVSSNGELLFKKYQEDGSMVFKLTLVGETSIEFQGTNEFQTISTAEDGVYCIWPGDKLAKGGESFCKGVALINSATSQKLMIEKFEFANNTESTNVYKTAAQQLGSTETFVFSWGGYGTTSGTFVSTNVGDGSSNSNGYLPMPDGNYNGTPNLNGQPSNWIGTGGALSDFAGYTNGQIIKDILDNGTETSNTNAPMAYLMNAFNDPNCSQTVNQGYNDWYIPSCGQLGLMWLNKTDINNALTAMGGTIFSVSYWSSSEYSSDSGWYVSLNSGEVNISTKDDYFCIRLVRDLQ